MKKTGEVPAKCRPLTLSEALQIQFMSEAAWRSLDWSTQAYILNHAGYPAPSAEHKLGGHAIPKLKEFYDWSRIGEGMRAKILRAWKKFLILSVEVVKIRPGGRGGFIDGEQWEAITPATRLEIFRAAGWSMPSGGFLTAGNGQAILDQAFQWHNFTMKEQMCIAYGWQELYAVALDAIECWPRTENEAQLKDLLKARERYQQSEAKNHERQTIKTAC